MHALTGNFKLPLYLKRNRRGFLLLLLLIGVLLLIFSSSGEAQNPTIDLFTLEEQTLKNNPLIKDKKLEIEILQKSLRNFKAENNGVFSFTASYYPSSEYAEKIIGYRYGLSGAFKYPLIGESKDITFKRGNLEALILIKKAELEEIKNSLLFKLRREYVNYYYSLKLKKEIEENIKELKKLEEKVRLRLLSKMALNVDLLSIDTLIAKLESQKSQIIASQLESLAKIKTITANPYLTEFTPTLNFSRNIENIYLPPLMELFNFAKEHRKDIELTRQAYLKLFQAADKSAKAYPKAWISLTGAATSYDLNTIDSGIGLLFTFIFPREKELAQKSLLEERHLRAIREKNRIEIIKTSVLTDLQTAISGFNTFRDKYFALKKEYEAICVELNTLKNRAHAGLITGTDLLMKEALLLNRKNSTCLMMMDSYKNMLNNYFLLLKGLGVREIPWLIGIKLPQTQQPKKENLQLIRYSYVWDSKFLGKFSEENKFLQNTVNLGLKGIYISLNRKQIKEFLFKRSGREKLANFIKRAKSKGLEVQLLLGEPTWIYPENRENLLKIISYINKFNRENPFKEFSGIHLDIEPHSLPEWKEKKEQLSKFYLETLRDVKLSTLIPVYADIPISYLNNGLAERVLKLIDGVTLMNYTTNLNKLRQAAGDCQGLSRIYGKELTISLSVEENQPGYISFFHQPKEKLEQALRTLEEIGIRKVAFQDFKGYEKYFSFKVKKENLLKAPQNTQRGIIIVFTSKLPSLILFK